MHLKNSELSFFTNNASFAHFHQVSINSITNWTFSKIQLKFGTINNEEIYYNKRYLHLRLSKYNETSPKLVYSEETSDTVMREKFQQILMQNAKVLNQDR